MGCSDFGSKGETMRAGSRSRRGQRGSTLMLFTLMLPALLIPITGLAIDASVLYIVQARLATAVDGAALGAGRLLGTPANPAEIAGEFLNANYPASYWGSYNLTPNITVTTTFSTHTISVSATVDVPLLFMRIFGQDHSAVAASAIATRKDTRIVLVLDRSGSMTSELSTLKTAANQFVNMFTTQIDELGLVVYGSSALVAYPTTRPYDASPTSAGGPDVNFGTTQTNGNMLDMINYMSASGATNMSAALSLAYIELQKGDHRDNDPTKLNAIVLFTDGVPTSMTVNLNDPSNLPNSNSLKPYGTGTGQSRCTYDPGTVGDTTTQMIGWIGGWGIPSSTGFGSGIYRLASAPNDTNSTTYWMQHPTADMNPINPTKPISGCTYLQATQSNGDLNDLRQLPPQSYYGDSTSQGTAYQQSVLYNNFHTTYDPTNLSNAYHLGIACWNATDTAAQRILADTHLNIAIYVIGFTGNGGVDEALLKRVSNTLDSTNRNPDWQTGIYVAASDSNGLHNAFKTVASEILRLAK
jgi:Flp pilus assembly protein TadG